MSPDDKAASAHWWGEPTLLAYNDGDTLLAIVPIAFLTASKCNTWDYVTDIVEAVVGSFQAPPQWIERTTGAYVDQSLPPAEGAYTLHLQPAMATLPSPSPPQALTISETGSDGSIPSLSRHLKLDVVLRDRSACVVTGHVHHSNEAAHLVPRARGRDRFATITGCPAIQVDSVQCAILLDPFIRQMYDKYELALVPVGRANLTSDESGIPEDEMDMSTFWIVHIFLPPPASSTHPLDIYYRSLHGKVIHIPLGPTAPYASLATHHYMKAVRIRFGMNEVVPARHAPSVSEPGSPPAKRQRA